jgi:hypothetical protein
MGTETELGRELQALSERLQAQERETAYLRDRLAIQDCINRHARGVDRHDEELMSGSYHPDGVARYGSAIVPGPEHGSWSNGAHGERFALHLHNITTQTVELQGDTAYAESYVLASFLAPDNRRSSIVAGRYFDQLEKRDGEWKILVRRTVVDICTDGDASYLGRFRHAPVEEEIFWTRDDISYRRPLDVDSPVPSWQG